MTVKEIDFDSLKALCLLNRGHLHRFRHYYGRWFALFTGNLCRKPDPYFSVETRAGVCVYGAGGIRELANAAAVARETSNPT